LKNNCEHKNKNKSTFRLLDIVTAGFCFQNVLLITETLLTELLAFSAMATNFVTQLGNSLWRGFWVASQQDADIADTLHLRNVAMATIFWLSIGLYGVHIDATWQIRLNCPSATAMWPYVKLLW